MIALVQRPRRKAHLASMSHSGEWVSVCDRIVSADARVTPLDVAIGTIDAQAGVVCVDCHRLILMAGVVHQLGIGALLASLEAAA